MSEPCIHENDFGTIFERMEGMTKSFEGQRIAVNGLLKYMYEKEAIDANHEKQALTTRQKASIYVSAILGASGIICTIILKFV